MNTPASYPSAEGPIGENPVQPANARSETTVTTQLGGGDGLTKDGALAAQNRPLDAGRSSKAGRCKPRPLVSQPSRTLKAAETRIDQDGSASKGS